MSSHQEEETFEESLRRLEKVTAALENPETGLEEAIDLYEQGTKLAKQCQERLDRAEQRVERLQTDLADEEEVSEVEDPPPPDEGDPMNTLFS